MFASRRHPVVAVTLFLLSLTVSSSALAATKSVIVELADEAVAMKVARARAAGTPLTDDQIQAERAKLSAKQNLFLDALRSRGIAFALGGATVGTASQATRIDFRYTLVFNGVNLIVAEELISQIRALPQVKAVHDDPILKPALNVSVPYIRAPKVYGVVKELTRYDTMREGYEGQGTIISVIDSGVDWSHEMFGGDPTPPRLGVLPDAAALNSNQKVIYYLPLADSAVNDTTGHGTHVASTAAGYRGYAPGPDGLPLTGDEVEHHGVAPQARVMSYKVCGDVGSISGAAGCIGTVVGMALEDSVSPRTVTGFPKPIPHVINMSLGGAGNPGDFFATAADNAARMGSMVVAAAGNDGPGDGTAGSPCVGKLVTCVANSVDAEGSWSIDVLDPSTVNKLTPGAVTPAANLRTATGQRTGVPLFIMSGSKTPPPGALAQYLVYVVGGETPAAYPAAVRGRIALVRAGLPATFAQVANSAAAMGALAVVYDSDLANPTAVKATIPAVNITKSDFNYLVSLISGSPSVNPASGAISNYPVRFSGSYDVPTISPSSSRGPVVGFGQVKPDLSAPGTLIMAAAPTVSEVGAMGDVTYSAISGTSMASPHVAGAAALVKQAHPGWSGDMIRTVLMNTATNLRNSAGAANSDTNIVERVLDQGAGLIDVEAAVNAKALMGVAGDGVVDPSILGGHSFAEVQAINGRAVITRNVTVTLQDLSGSGGTYSLSVVNNRGLERAGFSASVSPSSITIPAGGSATVTASVSIDGNVVTSGGPIDLQWYVRARRSDATETLTMPFYARITNKVPAPATMNPIADDATPDRQEGIDRDGRFQLSWSYPAPSLEPARPCGYRIEEARPGAGGSVFYDDAEDPMLLGVNGTWDGADWVARPHRGTLSLGYAPIYIDNSTAAIVTASDIALPASAVVTLTYESDQDLEPDFDYGFVDISTDGGATFTQLASYTGAFLGQRSLDLSVYSGRSVRLRFRIVTDQLISTPAHQGWTIDDIRIQAGATFTAVANVGATTSSLAIGGKTDGTYAYRVVALFGNCSSNPFVGIPSNIEQVTVQVATAPPMAVFTNGPNPSETGQSVAFDASGSRDQDNVGGTPGIARYEWSFGDGNTASSTTPNVTHTYAMAGTYRVALTVVDDDGEAASSEALQTVTDSNAAISGGGNVPTSDGKSNFGADITKTPTSVGGDVHWHDKVNNVKLRSTRITRVERTGNAATVYGECTINKNQPSTFVMELVDNGETGDTIRITAGTYSSSGTVSGGGVRVTD